jgi:cell division protein FtsW
VKKGQLEATLLVLVTLGLVAFGLVMVYSATSAPAALGGGDPGFYLKRQTIYALIGLGLMLGATRIDYRRLKEVSPLLLGVSAFLCLAVLGIGQTVNGAKRWLTIGPAVFQPSELAKLAIAIWAAAYLATRKPPKTIKELARPLGLVTAVFGLLIMAEPDLGTTITIVVMLCGVLVVSGTPVRLLALSAGTVSLLALAAIWVEPYRRERFLSFLHPWNDQLGTGFQSVQAMIGLGSGGLFGKGIGESLLKLNYLPEAHTDMIFAIVGEELGLVGVTMILSAYAVFAFAGYTIALRCKDPFGKRLAVALTTLVCGQAIVNLAAVLGLAPLTGIPLPFVSAGGSSLVVALAAVGVLLNIAADDGVAARSVGSDRGRRDRRPRPARARSRGGAQGTRRTGDVRRVAGSARSSARP